MEKYDSLNKLIVVHDNLIARGQNYISKYHNKKNEKILYIKAKILEPGSNRPYAALGNTVPI